MGKIKFKDAQDLPVGSHSPCQLTVVKYREPTEELLARYPDMGPSWQFSFKLHEPTSPHDGYTGVRSCNHSDSRLGHLYCFLVDMSDGAEPEEVDPESFLGKWFTITLRKKQNGKLHVATAVPIPTPAGCTEEVKKTADVGAGGEEDDNIPF